ncbi:hypothetical protein CJ030_MR5G006251 [Morella rubra]|uniref:Disease resistance RPP13-like protein 1 n=1 Tax=Morella rubra TaxID=262757 RepID=A0A6A1VKV1_9ROSI|nr:hypothetical protein CJ030_MR5G006251 [Morella rubra]
MQEDVRIVLEELPTGRQKLEVRRVNEVVSLEGIMDSSSHLQELQINDCNGLMSLPWGGLLSALKSVSIHLSRELELPIDTNYSSLETLSLWQSCDSLRFFPLELFPKLKDLRITSCRNLECLTVPEEHEPDLVISKIQIWWCNKFVSFPKGGLRAPSLTSLEVGFCESLTSLPDKMHLLLPSLLTLRIEFCGQIESFPEGGLPSKLNSLSIQCCDKLFANRIGWGLQNHDSLTTLSIGGVPKGVKSFPEAGFLPTGLIDLRIYHFQDLKSLDKNGFQHLTSLEKLYLWRCKKLEHMPEEGLPASLSLVEIEKLSFAEKRVEKEKRKRMAQDCSRPQHND